MALAAIILPLVVYYLVARSVVVDISTTFLDDGYDDN